MEPTSAAGRSQVPSPLTLGDNFAVASDSSAPARVVGGLLGIVALLVVELIVTLTVYTGLNIYSLEVFGALVRAARSVQDVMTALVERFLPGSANTVYATLLGELGPKAILLLLLGLVVATIVRGLARLAGSALHG